MTINVDPGNIKDALWVLLIVALIYLCAKFAAEQWDLTRRDRLNTRQRQLDAEQAEADRAAARRRIEAAPLPGPQLAGEAARRISYAAALDAAGRPAEAFRQRDVAGQLGALAHLALLAADEGDREAWSAELDVAVPLVGEALLPVPNWTDPRPPAPTSLAVDRGYAEEFTPRWVEAVTALKQAVADNWREDDFGVGVTGRGVLTCAGAYGYEAAPELPTSTVEEFLRDYCHALYGEEPERTWPVEMPAPEPTRVAWARRMAEHTEVKLFPEDGAPFLAEIAELRQHVDAVLRVSDFRGLMGRGTSQIIEEVIDRFGLGRLDHRTVNTFVSDYAMAITGQRESLSEVWLAHLPDTDPSRVLPLRDELQPAEVRD